MLMSSVVLKNTMMASTLLFTALGTGVGSYLSLCLSHCRENKINYTRWARFFQFFILFGYFLFVMGT